MGTVADATPSTSAGAPERAAGVFAKVAFLVLALGLLAASLLTLRQMRTQAAHELARARLRILDRESELQRIRMRIGELVTPEHIEALSAGLVPMRPIAAPPPPPADAPLHAHNSAATTDPPAPR